MRNRNAERSTKEKDEDIVDVDESILSRVSSLQREREGPSSSFLSLTHPTPCV